MEKIEVNDCEEVLSSMKLIIENIKEVIDKLDRETIKAMLQKTIDANQIFVMGAGRSRLVAKAFAMRLMQLGLIVYVVGETTTPAVLPQDVVIAISGSGETRTVADLGKLAKDIGSTLITITSKKDSTLGRISDIAVITKIDLVSQAEREVFRYGVSRAAHDVTIMESNALYGIGIDPIVRRIELINDLEFPMFLRGNPPVGTCTICVGKKEIGAKNHFGVLRTMDQELFYVGE